MRTRLPSGEEVGKTDPRIEAVGSMDELSSHVGLARALAGRYGGLCSALAREMHQLQLDLSRLACELGSPDPGEKSWIEPTTDGHVQQVEKRIAELEHSMELPRAFIVPGACEASAAMDIARAVARRAERQAVKLAEEGLYNNRSGLVYLNRLSDYLFLLARAIEKAAGVAFSTKEET